MASSARHLFLLAFVTVLAFVAPRAGAWGGGRLFFSKTTRPEPAVDEPAEKATADATTAVPAADPNGATAAFSRPSTGGSGGRGYGLYGRPEENFPPDYFRRGVHRNAEKLTTTTNVPTTSADEAAVPVGGRGEGAKPLAEDNGSGRGRPPWTSTEETVPVGGRGGERSEPFAEDNGSGRGRPRWTNTNVPTTTLAEETVPPEGGRGGERTEPFVEDNGSGRGRAPWHYGRPDADGRPEEEQRNYGMSDTRLYQNGRYYYDVDAGRYGYGRESNSNPVRTRPEEFGGSGSGERRGRYYYGNAAGYYRYGNGNEFRNGFQEEGQNGRYIP